MGAWTLHEVPRIPASITNTIALGSGRRAVGSLLNVSESPQLIQQILVLDFWIPLENVGRRIPS